MIAIMPPLGTKKNLPERTKHVQFAHQQTLRIGFAPAPEGKIAVAQANLRLVDGTFMDRSKALNAVLSQIACASRNDSITGRGNSEGTGFATIETSGPEAELFALAEKVESAEKDFHNALLCRKEAQIAYLRDPSIMTLQALENSRTAEAVALEILDTQLRRLASTRATTVIGLKLKASYASTDGKLADSIVGDLLQL
jgi:hypothetical protein